jgi:TPR repeat protein
MNTTAGKDIAKTENYLKALAISPANMLLHEQMLYSLLPRWGGSYDAMLKYIEAVSPNLESEKDQIALASIIKAETADEFLRREKYAESYDLYNEVLELTTPSLYLCSRAYLGYKLKKESATIVSDLKKAGMKTNPAVYCASRVEIFAIENAQSADAIPLLNTYLEHFPKNPELHSAKGWVMQERGDQPSAYKSFLKSAELGGIYGQTMAGKYLFSGWGGPVDRDKAMVYLSNAAEKGEKNAQLSMVQALQFLGRNDESIKLKNRYETMSIAAKN